MGLFIDRFVECRKNMGLTQAELANLVELSLPTIARIESGESDPKSKDLAKLSIALGTSVSYLMGETDDPQSSVPVDKPSSHHLAEGKNVVLPMADSTAPVVFQVGEMRLELPPTPETYAFLERQLKGILPSGEKLPESSQEDAGEHSA